MLTIEDLKELAGKTPEEVLAFAEKVALEQEEQKKQNEIWRAERDAEPFDPAEKARMMSYRIDEWLRKGVPVKTVQLTVALALSMTYLTQGYVFTVNAKKI